MQSVFKTKPRRSGVAVMIVSGAAIALAAMLMPANAESIKLGYSAPFLTDPFQAIMANQTLKAVKDAGMEAMPATNANGDAGKQATDIRNLISAGAKVLIVNPTDSQAIVPVLEFAASKNVPTVLIDIAPAKGKSAMIVRADNKGIGGKACEALGAAIGGKGKVLSLMGDQATTNGRDRTTGFNECMKAKYPDVTIIEQPTYWKTDKATSAAQTVVTTTPDLVAIYMQSDSVMLAGVLNVLKSAGKLTKVGEPNHIFLATVDGTPYALEKIREDLLDVAVAQPLDLYAKYGAFYAKAAAEGKTFAAGPTDHNSEIVPVGDNLMDYLPATVVTKANASDPSLWGNQTDK
ncbi:sugar ABC transporter substrate-binding protein [Mesorhizobium sp. YC-39]|uniref:sugar ABC transporter substrate-binding protein n=1 Tax=unclassified Mesorhizobium TaxID=325217 RepID=UPI0021E87274|nr:MULTISPECIES: sugar ABC transporter substrate-binding protein [unclassified Mesorhizobium]MCV3206605.1 sugar ABC transporter substrate-binding protein [Mesorhizobium sp. YC-2]MCV3226995.1 sugar ABC transporter substrate-binding protein [Mesorhizobium sp. YC-39]